jgi:hypothetical protein
LNFFNVAQRNLIGYAQGLAEEEERDRLKFNPLLPLAEVARRKLTNFRVNQDPKTNHESFGAPKREGEFDDIVYSVALACWLRHYHLSVEAWWIGKSSARALGRGPEPLGGALREGRRASVSRTQWLDCLLQPAIR